jgi:hypothetical protein
MVMKHPCGCETKKLPDGSIAIKPCKLHRNQGHVWIALQHKEKKQKPSEPELTVIQLEAAQHQH